MSSAQPWHRKGPGKGLGKTGREVRGPQHGAPRLAGPNNAGMKNRDHRGPRVLNLRTLGAGPLVWVPGSGCTRDTTEGPQQREEQRRRLCERRPGLLWRPREQRNTEEVGAHFSRATQSLQTQTKPGAGELGTERGWTRGEASPGVSSRTARKTDSLQYQGEHRDKGPRNCRLPQHCLRQDCND